MGVAGWMGGTVGVVEVSVNVAAGVADRMGGAGGVADHVKTVDYSHPVHCNQLKEHWKYH